MAIATPPPALTSVFPITGGPVAEAAARITERIQRSVPIIYGPGGNGSGVVWRADGQIITNSHVVSGDRADVRFGDGTRYDAQVIARHAERDLALLKVDADDLPAITVGDSSAIRPGQLAIAIGHPMGFRDAVTVGVVVAAGQAATVNGPKAGDFIQTDVTLLPGNSGGPLVDANGHVIGINTMINGALSLAIPSQAVERFVAGGRTGTAAFLGINGIIVPLRDPAQPIGFLLTDVLDGTPADRAGLLIGDVVIAIDGAPLQDQESLPAALLRLSHGAPVELHVHRGGEPRTFTVVPTERA